MSNIPENAIGFLVCLVLFAALCWVYSQHGVAIFVETIREAQKRFEAWAESLDKERSE